MTRTTRDLIEELDRESKQFNLLALVVGFEKRTDLVYASDESSLEKLNGLVEAGGEPIGLIGATLDRNIGTIRTKALQEYQDQEWVQGYLDELAQTIGQGIIASGKAKSFVRGSSWIN